MSAPFGQPSAMVNDAPRPRIAAPRIIGQRTMLRMMGETAAISFAVAVINAAALSTLARRFDTRSVAAFLLAKRIASSLLPFTSVMSALTLARYVAAARDELERRQFLFTATMLVLAACTLLASALVTPRAAARLLLGDGAQAPLITGVVLILVGQSCLSPLFGYLRGRGSVLQASFWQLILFAIPPYVLVQSARLSPNVGSLLFWSGAIGCISVPLLLCRALASDAHIMRVDRHKVVELMRYGAPRMPSNIAFQGLLTCGSWWCARGGNATGASYLLASLATLQIFDVAAASYQIVVVPRAASLEAVGRTDYLRQRCIDLLQFTCYVSAFALLHTILWLRVLFGMWLGKQFEPATTTAAVLLLALPAYLAYSLLRGIIDGIESRAVNTLNVGIAFGIACIGSAAVFFLFGGGTAGYAIVSVVGIWVLGIRTAMFLARRYGITVSDLRLQPLLVVNVALSAPSFLLYAATHHLDIGWRLLTMCVLGEGALFALYIFTLWKLGLDWVGNLVQRVAASWNPRGSKGAV